MQRFQGRADDTVADASEPSRAAAASLAIGPQRLSRKIVVLRYRRLAARWVWCKSIRANWAEFVTVDRTL
jgi:hypothetical protein